jgi:hypothetical protein
MSAPATPVSTDRSDFRTVMIGGTKLGLAIGTAVVAFLVVSRMVPVGLMRDATQTLVVLAAGCAAAFLPARWVEPRSVEGVAGAAALGLWGAVVFSAFDIILLRPFDAYPWTWDAIGGYSTWWYLPLWWMLGTVLAWMGALAAEPMEEASLTRLALPGVVGAAVLGVVGARVLGVALPVATGGGFAVTLTVRAMFALARGR